MYYPPKGKKNSLGTSQLKEEIELWEFDEAEITCTHGKLILFNNSIGFKSNLQYFSESALAARNHVKSISADENDKHAKIGDDQILRELEQVGYLL